METMEIETYVKSFLKEECHLDADTITPDDFLFSSYQLSSIDFIDLLAFIERQFGVTLDATDASFENLDTIGRIVELIHRRSRKA